MNEQLLTIAIPTYNRAQQLQKTLRAILPQVKEHLNVCMLIIDNNSITPAQKVYETLNIEVAGNRIKFIRNNVNIGANANIMRCFEMCTTPWLWVLSDDDNPSPDAVKTILQDVNVGHCFAFYTVPQIKKPIFKENKSINICGTDFDELVSYFGRNKLEIAFLSAAIFNMEAIRPYITDGYLSANTGLPHLIMLFKALNQGHYWMLSQNVIADYCPPEKGQGWGFMSFVFTMTTLLGLASTNSDIRIIRTIMIKGWRPSPKKILYSLSNRYFQAGCTNEIRYLFKIAQNIYAPSWREDIMLNIRWHITYLYAFCPKSFSKNYMKRKAGKVRINLENEERR